MDNTLLLTTTWRVEYKGFGRGDVTTRVVLRDGRGINYSGRLSKSYAIQLAYSQMRAWQELDMVDDGLAAFNTR